MTARITALFLCLAVAIFASALGYFLAYLSHELWRVLYKAALLS